MENIKEESEMDHKDIDLDKSSSLFDEDTRVCRICGCTQYNACEGGCWWVSEDLCSQCVDAQANIKEKKIRITCEVSEEIVEMWQEITSIDQKKSKKRYYPAHTMERLIRAEYELLAAFGPEIKNKR